MKTFVLRHDFATLKGGTCHFVDPDCSPRIFLFLVGCLCTLKISGRDGGVVYGPRKLDKAKGPIDFKAWSIKYSNGILEEREECSSNSREEVDALWRRGQVYGSPVTSQPAGRAPAVKT